MKKNTNTYGDRGSVGASSVGPVIGTIIIIALLALGALYFWGEKLNRNTDATPYVLDNEYTVSPQAEGWLPDSSTSDEADAIEKDLEAFSPDALQGKIDSDFDLVGAGL
ncbi:MAG TPA: hypothetical protein VJH33_02095 [Candidatus Paceibacterota bacterium]